MRISRRIGRIGSVGRRRTLAFVQSGSEHLRSPQLIAGDGEPDVKQQVRDAESEIGVAEIEQVLSRRWRRRASTPFDAKTRG